MATARKGFLIVKREGNDIFRKTSMLLVSGEKKEGAKRVPCRRPQGEFTLSVV